MDLDTLKQPTHTGRLTSPELRLRNSTTLWGPLQVTLSSHREGAELGYQAGEEAYRQLVERHGQSIGFIPATTMSDLMHTYLTEPRYRPRTTTGTMLHEWKAMFVLAWSACVLEEIELGEDTYREDEAPTRHTNPPHPSYTEAQPVRQPVRNEQRRYRGREQ